VPDRETARRRTLDAPRWVVLPAAAALIAIVALSSRSTSIAATPGAIDLRFIHTAIEVLGYVGLFVGIGFVVAAAAFLDRRRRRRDVGPVTPRELPGLPLGVRILGVAFVLLVVTAEIGVVLAYLDELRRARAGAGTSPADGTPPLDPSSVVPPGSDVTSLAIAVVIVTVLVVVLVAFAIRWRSSDDRFRSEEPRERRVATVQAVEVGLDALRREPDPRRAVIAAYAAMERSLAGVGLGRDRSEAPLEYLRRVLAGPTDAADEVRTITHLFQVAKFSRHAVDEAMRTSALRALEAIRARTSARA
jgi:uncharacterized membrane protein YidH (DUF202 family)